MELFVGNIPYAYSKVDLEELFASCGHITHIRMMMDRKTGRFRGFAFLQMQTEAGEREALALHNKMVAVKQPETKESSDDALFGSLWGRRRSRKMERKLIVLPARSGRRFRPRKKKERVR